MSAVHFSIFRLFFLLLGRPILVVIGVDAGNFTATTLLHSSH